jgi:hypothetical protein
VLLMNEYVDVSSLSLENRFDIYIKHIYARYRELGVGCAWPKELYLEHLRIFNQYFENDGSGKCGKRAFLSSFDAVLDSVKGHGYLAGEEAVSVGVDRVPLNGAHRVTACLLYNKQVRIEQQNVTGSKYDYEWFRRYGLTSNWADPAALEYCRLNNDAIIVFIYPAAKGKQREVREILDSAGKIFYEKDISFTKTGQVRLMRQVYAREKWLGNWMDGFVGARRKAGWCFTSDEPVKVYVIKSNVDAMLNAKLRVRDLFQVENNSMHSTDTHEECLRLAQQLFNDNSINFLNHASATRCKTYEMLIAEFKAWMSENNLDPELFCIDGSAVMSAYGIRDARDLDYIHYGNELINCDRPGIGNHNTELRFHPVSKDNIIFDPKNHFYYDGIKYVALPIIREMKMTRSEIKDQKDVELIDNYLAGKQKPFSLNILSILRQIIRKEFLIAKLRAMKLRVDILLFKLFRK